MKIPAIAFLLMMVCSSSRVIFGFNGEPYSAEGCGETRGCFDCRDRVDTCAVNVAWEPDTDAGVVKFTLWGSEIGSDAHVSMGITKTGSMFSADVYSCISDGTRLVRSWNPSALPDPPRTTSPRNITGRVYDQEVNVVDGEIRCEFYRYMSLDDNDPEFFDISGDNRYFLILSAGGLNAQGLVAGHLPSNRSISSPVTLSQVGSAGKLVMSQFGVWTLLWSLIVAFHVTK